MGRLSLYEWKGNAFFRSLVLRFLKLLNIYIFQYYTLESTAPTIFPSCSYLALVGIYISSRLNIYRRREDPRGSKAREIRGGNLLKKGWGEFKKVIESRHKSSKHRKPPRKIQKSKFRSKESNPETVESQQKQKGLLRPLERRKAKKPKGRLSNRENQDLAVKKRREEDERETSKTKGKGNTQGAQGK